MTDPTEYNPAAVEVTYYPLTGSVLPNEDLRIRTAGRDRDGMIWDGAVTISPNHEMYAEWRRIIEVQDHKRGPADYKLHRAVLYHLESAIQYLPTDAITHAALEEIAQTSSVTGEINWAELEAKVRIILPILEQEGLASECPGGYWAELRKAAEMIGWFADAERLHEQHVLALRRRREARESGS